MTSQDGERERERGMEREGEREECACERGGDFSFDL